MSRLVERYPQARRLPSSEIIALVKLLEPYLGWVLAEIDTRSLDILICDSDDMTSGKPQHLVLLTGRAVTIWQKNASSSNASKPGHTPAE